MEDLLTYLEQLVKIASPTGFTANVTAYLEKALRAMGYQPKISPKGNVTVTVKGQNDDAHRLLTAHVDTLGAIVRSIKHDGRIKMDKIGGYAWNMIEGENCLVHLDNGKSLSGTILVHETSVHVYRNAGEVTRSQDNMEIRLDCKTNSSKETEELGVNIGDFVSFDPRFIVTENGFVKSRFLDDKASVAILLTLLSQLKKTGKVLPYTTHFMFSVFEEVGHGANSSIKDKVVEYLAVDMGAMGDDQQTDEYTVSICVKDGSGPYHYGLRSHLTQLAKKHNIPYKLDIYPYYGSDASAAMSAGYDVKHALIGPGIESSHSYERTHTDSLKATQDLVEAYLLSEIV